MRHLFPLFVTRSSMLSAIVSLTAVIALPPNPSS